ncbi:LytTR family DNA-binding domain-containing protein [Ekhidna sp. MALMAid0563]|uniref:LytR/AlgR family response regulator transcription factor n=1 Tax=Ekhidna sp. MALMAid0563 TaxID=3143937 RepID=UPI0032DE5713
MIRILVVEDEALVAQRLIRFIRESDDHPKEINHVQSLATAESYLSNHTIDLLFLDLNLHGKQGFDLLKNFVHKTFHTIIVSAYTDKAIEAFEYGVLDYICKPFTQERIKKALVRFTSNGTTGSGSTTHLAVRVKNELKFIPLQSISHLQAASIYSELVLMNGEKYVYDKPLNSLMQLLPEQYKRIHRSYAVDISRIESIVKVKHNTYQAQLINGHSLPISRSIRQELRSLLATK